MAAVGMWIVGVLVVCGAVTFFLDSLRGAQLDRQQRRIEQLQAEEQRLLRAQDAGGGAPDPVCGCGHHLAQHDRRGRCHEEVSRPTGWDAEHRPTGYAPAGCTCQRYVGPQPLSQVYADELTELEPEVPDGPGRAVPDGGGGPAEGGGDGDAEGDADGDDGDDGGPRPEEGGPPRR
ncbi:hypothetical protein [Streptomyces bohaiensis]|uniref:hypothetical protein n=1 Tax=Streptomyces bohaiensis TaxID=1431344 RepID=UPI0028ADD4E0|nr:hypothetical protein [Streptomyces bohaiensis]